MTNNAYFSMSDLQEVWENGGQQAYFAGGGAMVHTPLKNSTTYDNRGVGRKEQVGKGLQKVAVKGENGLMYYANRVKRFGESAAIGTANNVGKGIKSAGQGVANAGGFVRDRANQLGGVIRKNPRAAGAVILGGTALGVGGGAYAMSRRDKN
jgi:hypothetical protein